MHAARGDPLCQWVYSPARFQRLADEPVNLHCRVKGSDQVRVRVGGHQFVAHVYQGRDASGGQWSPARLPSLDGVERDPEQLGKFFLAQPRRHSGELEHEPGYRSGRRVRAALLHDVVSQTDRPYVPIPVLRVGYSTREYGLAS